MVPRALPTALPSAGDKFAPHANESRLRMQTIIRLRWFGVGGQLLTVAGVGWGLGFDFPAGLCLVLIAISAWVNVFLRMRYPARYRLSPAFAAWLLAYDILELAALLFLTGGIENPFTFLIVVPVTVSAATLPARNTIMLGLFAAVATLLLVEVHLPLPWSPPEGLAMPRLYKVGVLASIGAGMIFLALYAARLSKEARQMSAALAATEHILAREQRLHALDGLAAAAAHELGTPLATISVVTKELEREPGLAAHVREDVMLLRSQAERCREILQKLTRKPEGKDPHHASLAIEQLLKEAAEPYRFGRAKVVISAQPADTALSPNLPEPVAERRPGMIYGLGNIIENAVDFASEKVEVAARWDEKEVSITVADDGPGFAPDIMDSLGEPYVTTRGADERSGDEDPEAGGLGLGFFIAKTLLERSGGRLLLANAAPPDKGAVVRIIWPRQAFEVAPGEWSAVPGRQAAAE